MVLKSNFFSAPTPLMDIMENMDDQKMAQHALCGFGCSKPKEGCVTLKKIARQLLQD